MRRYLTVNHVVGALVGIGVSAILEPPLIALIAGAVVWVALVVILGRYW